MIAKKVHKNALRRLMARRGMTGPEVARILGVAPQTVYCYMCGVRTMTQRDFERVQNAELA